MDTFLINLIYLYKIVATCPRNLDFFVFPAETVVHVWEICLPCLWRNFTPVKKKIYFKYIVYTILFTSHPRD